MPTIPFLALLTSLLALLALAVPAQAEQVRRLQGTFGSAAQPQFDEPAGLAVYQSSPSGAAAGDLLVADQGADTLSRYHEDGTPAPFSALGTNVIDGRRGPGGKPCAEEAASCDEMPFPLEVKQASETQVAIDESAALTAGDIYLTDPTNSKLHVFAPSGAYLGALGEFGATGFGNIGGVAVDAAGTLYVGDYSRSAIHKFAPSANPPKASDFTADCKPGGHISNLAAGAGPSAGSLFAVSDSANVGVVRLNAAGCATQLAKIAPFDAFTTLAVDPVSGHPFVSLALGSRVNEYDATGALVATAAPPTLAKGLAMGGPSGRLHLSLGSEGSGRIDLYGAPVTIPTVETLAASSITPTKATLNGTVNPDGAPVTGCFFEYVADAQFSEDGFASADTVPCEEAIPTDENTHPVSARITGLTEAGTFPSFYRFRLIATSECEPLAHPGEQCLPTKLSQQSITLPRVAKTGAASGVGGASATLNGTVNPDGTAVGDCHFEYLPEATWQAGLANELQTITLDGATGGTFTLSFEGETTDPIAFDAPSSAFANSETVERKLNDLLSLGKSFNVVVSGPDGGPYTVEFRGDLKNTDVPELIADPAGLQPPGASVTVTTTRQGSNGWAPAASVPCAESGAQIGEGEEAVPVHAELSGLQPGTAYRFRLLASNANVTDASSPPSGAQFTTKSTVETKPASEVGGLGATLNGTVDPFGEAVTECFFEYGTSTAYGQSAPCAESAAEIEAGAPPVPVHAEIAGLAAGTTYHFRLLAELGGVENRGADLELITLGPRIEAQWAAEVTPTEAILRAQINPRGAPTAYRLQWGPAADPEANTTAPVTVGEDSTPHTVSVPLAGLEAGSEYRYRFLADANCNPAEPTEECAAEGPELAFRTYPQPAPPRPCPNDALRTGPSAALPDCRAYELVSPLDKNGGGVVGADVFTGGARGMPGQSSLDGEALAYGSRSAFAGAQSANFHNPYLARRGEEGWTTEAIAPPLESPGVQNSPFGVESELFAYSPDLSSAWLFNENLVPLTDDAQSGYRNLYRRESASGAYQALTVNPPLGPVPGSFSSGLAGVFVGAADDLSVQVFQTRVRLTDNAEKNSNPQIYAFAEGELHLASVLPNGTANPANSEAGSPFYFMHEGYGAMRHALAEDGSRIFWTSNAVSGSGFGTVYVRENPLLPESTAKDGAGNCVREAGRACTTRLSPGIRSLFLTARPDGTQALLLTGGSLEVVDTASGAATAVASGLPERTQPQKYINTGLLGAAEDLSRLYFVSEEDLAPGASEGANNLYAYHEGAYELLGELSDNDVEARFSPVALSANSRLARVSPEGTHLSFVSDSASLAEQTAGYDNTDTATGRPSREVYLYDATADGGDGLLRCVSCNPSGARPGAAEPLAASFEEVSQPPASAALLPVEPSVYHSSRPLSADGRRLFFNAFDALLPRDTNGTWDVYQWEAPGSGSCEEGDADYFQRSGGCLSLISTGTDPQPSEFFDADPEGRNVFIRTTASNDPRDPGAYDIYDARVLGGFPLPSAPAACEGEACQTPPEAPDDPTPASSAFEGAGNVVEAPARKPCRKGKVRRQGRCVKKHSKPKRSKRHRRGANHDRRAHR